MPPVIIGSGVNGLVAAFYLAKAGHRPLVLERRGIVGGAAITDAFAPGFRAPALAHALGPLRPSIVRDMELERRGVRFVQPDPRVTALSPDGRALPLVRDPRQAANAIRAFSTSDADRYGDFCTALGRTAGFVDRLMDMTPPSIDAPSKGELWELLKIGRQFRALGRTDEFRLLRWGPMAVADLVGEWFESELLQGVIAAQGIFGTAMGPWSAGTGAVLLWRAAADPVPGGSSVTARGGPGAVTHAMADAVRDAGGEIRTNADVVGIAVRDNGATGVVLADGTEIPASAVISSADPRATFLRLVDPIDLEPGFLTRIRNYRMPGTVAKVNLALGRLPSFKGMDAAPAGRLHIGPGIDYLERAFDASKYGELPAAPYLDATIPTLQDPSLAPAGKHVLSVYAQFMPYALRGGASWKDASGTLGDLVIETLEHYAPGLRSLVEHRQVITPLDLEQTWGMTGGHVFHGEPSLDQLFTMRPTLGWAKYHTPIARLFLCGSGTHPGNGLTGTSGRNAAREIARALKP
ncbi:MAG TPA: NAD(P)/FAD-dependent oxidoreductase [Vicinamibacterales bacterium]|nr:NAD(P)/FAD-dependent oxidoreductase [Vicinamibacterales bacterium]